MDIIEMKNVSDFENARTLEMHELESISGGVLPAIPVGVVVVAKAAGITAGGFGVGFGVGYGLSRWLG